MEIQGCQARDWQNQFIVQLKNYLAKYLELSGSSPGNFGGSQSERTVHKCLFWRVSHVPAWKRTWGPGRVNYMGSTVLAHKQQLGVKSKTTVKPKYAEQRTKNVWLKWVMERPILSGTRPKGLILTCEKNHLSFDLIWKFKSFCFSFLNQRLFLSSHWELEWHSFETCMTSEWSLIFNKYF